MQRIFLLVLILLSSQANAYVYRIDPSNKYHTPPPSAHWQDQHIASRTGEAIGKPVGYVVGGAVGAVAGLLEGLADGIEKGLDRTL